MRALQQQSARNRICTGHRARVSCYAGQKVAQYAAPTRHRRIAGQRRQVVYWPQFLDTEDFAIIKKECAKLRPKLREEVNCIAQGRLGCFVPSNSPIMRILKTLEVAEALTERLSPNGPLFLSDFPAELRVMRPGSFMPWHKDEAMYSLNQWECILTVDNTSDSRTQYIDAKSRLHEHWTEPNSLLAVEAEGWDHRVTPVKRGERTILKFCFTCTNSKLPSFTSNLEREAYR